MSDTERVKAIKSKMRNLDQLEMRAIIQYANKRQIKLVDENIAKRDADHDARIKALTIDTKVIIKFGQRSNEFGTIYRIGRKYVGVKLENGDNWRFPFRYVDERIDDKNVLLTAKTNRGFQGLFEG